MAKKPKKKQHDPLASLKYRAYCRAFTPPGDDTSMEDFVVFARHFLCRHSHRLWKDPIWDEYTDEEILIEYFAHLFTTDKGARSEFEVRHLTAADLYGEDIFEWLDRKVAENQEETKKILDSMPDKVSFRPGQDEDQEE